MAGSSAGRRGARAWRWRLRDDRRGGRQRPVHLARTPGGERPRATTTGEPPDPGARPAKPRPLGSTAPPGRPLAGGRAARRAPRGGGRPQGSRKLPGAGVRSPRPGVGPVEGRRNGRRGGRAERRGSPPGAGRNPGRPEAGRQRTQAQCSSRSPEGSRSAATARSRFPPTSPKRCRRWSRGRTRSPTSRTCSGAATARSWTTPMTARARSATRSRPGGCWAHPRPPVNSRLGQAGPGALHHGVRQRGAHVHVRGRDPLRHGRAQRRVRLTLAGGLDRQQRIRRAPLAGAVAARGGRRAPAADAPRRADRTRWPLALGRWRSAGTTGGCENTFLGVVTIISIVAVVVGARGRLVLLLPRRLALATHGTSPLVPGRATARRSSA